MRQVYGEVEFLVSPRVWEIAEKAINHPKAFDPEGFPGVIKWDIIFMSKMKNPPDPEHLMAILACGFGLLQPDGRIKISGAEASRESSKIQAMLKECFLSDRGFPPGPLACREGCGEELLESRTLTGAEVAEIVEAALAAK